jgi:hypothetical protein
LNRKDISGFVSEEMNHCVFISVVLVANLG